MPTTNIRTSVLIPADPEVVWTCLIDPEYQRQWMSGFEEAIPVQGAGDRPGDRLRLMIREGGKVRPYIAEILKFERPIRLSLVMHPEEDSERFRVTVTYELVRVPGGTDLTYSCELEMRESGCLMRLLAPVGFLFSRLLVRKFTRNLRKVAMKVQADETARTGAR